MCLIFNFCVLASISIKYDDIFCKTSLLIQLFREENWASENEIVPKQPWLSSLWFSLMEWLK